MSLVTPFSGQVVSPAWAARVVSPLHDVLTVEERRAIMAKNPDSYLYVTSDPQDLPLPPPDDDPGRANAIAQQRLLDLGAYGPMVTGSVFAYRMTERGLGHTGLVAQVAVSGFVDGAVLGHEAVRAERVAGLVRQFDIVPRRSDLVSLVHRGPGPTGAVESTGTPMIEVVDFSGVEQSVWRLDPAESAEVVRRLAATPLYVADGHHRIAASVTRWERDGRPEGASVLCVIYPEEQIQLYAFHRRVGGPVDATALLDAVSGTFDVRTVSGPTRQRGMLGLYLVGEWLELVPRSPVRRAGVAGLDVTMLDEEVLTPVLRIEPGSGRIEFVPELRDLAIATAACDQDGGALFTLHPPGLDDLVSVAERGEVMSAKSTYVQPKPRTGIFLH
jgi:uncharacterized protein (DUF1015 family)